MDIFYSIGAEAGRILLTNIRLGYDSQTYLFFKLTSVKTWGETEHVDKQGQATRNLLDRISGRATSTGVGIFPPSGVKDLLTRSWWARVWVLQEFLMATTATFICGHTRVPEPDFTYAVDIYLGYSNYLIGRDVARDPNAAIYMKTLIETRPGDQALYLLSMRSSSHNEAPSLMSLMGTLYDKKKVFSRCHRSTRQSLRPPQFCPRITWNYNQITISLVLKFTLKSHLQYCGPAIWNCSHTVGHT